MRIYLIPLFIVLIVLQTGYLAGQDQTWEKTAEGEIEDASFIVEKDREIELPAQARKFNKIPPLPVSENNLNIRPYTFHSIKPEYTPVAIKNRALKSKDEPLEKLYGGSMNLGFGNYITPYAELDLFNKREERYLLGFNALHLSSRTGPVDKESSGNGVSEVAFDSRLFGSRLVSGVSAAYERSFYHFYGYPDGLQPEQDSIRRTFNNFHINAFLGNVDQSDDFDYNLSVGYRYFNDNLLSSESDISLKLASNMYLSDELSFDLDGDLLFSTYSYLESINRNYIKIFPHVNYNYGEFDITAGLNFVFQNDTVPGRSDVLLYPLVQVDYTLSDYFSMFLKLDGDLEKITLPDMINENPFINPGAALTYTNKKFGLHWGLNGNIMNYVNFTAGFSLSELTDLYFFRNDSLDISRFEIFYEPENTSRANIYGELVYSRINAVHLSIRGDYFNYSMNERQEAWHKPAYRVKADLNYNLFNKIIFGSGIYILGGITYLDWSSDQVMTLDPVIDVNIDLNYRFSDQLGAFLNFNNILGNNYQTYWRYPARSIQVLGGVSLTF